MLPFPKIEVVPLPVDLHWRVREGMDWGKVRLLWEAGCHEGWILRRYPCRLGLLRKKSVEWDADRRRENMAVSDYAGPKSRGISSTDDVDTGSAYWLAGLAAIERPRWDDSVFPYAEMAEALYNVSIAMPLRLAAEAAGLELALFDSYRKIEPRLEQMVRVARAKATKPAIEKIMASNDWKAAAWLLERNLAREEFREEAKSQEKLVIEINVARDASAATGVIDITPEGSNAAVVASLPTQREAEDISRG